MKLRHEFKHEIQYGDWIALRGRLMAVMQKDPHAREGCYTIRSLYFDNLYDKALREKVNGVNNREKFRLRYYNGDVSYILLEKKSKINGLCNKQQVQLTLEETKKIVQSNYEELDSCEKPLVMELVYKMRMQGLRPSTIVDYTREPFIYDCGNVRVTIDYNLRTGMRSTDFLNPQSITIPAGNAPIILEVKWDEYLPSVIRSLVQLPSTRTAAFSKYAACRIYG